MRKIEYYEKFSKQICEFLGVKLELEGNGSQVEFIPKFKSNFMRKTLDQIGSFFIVADMILEKYYENNNSIYFSNLIEEFTQVLISEMVTKNFKLTHEQLNFIETLKEVSNETYENESSTLSVLIFKNKATIKEELDKIELDYLPFEEEKDIKEIFKEKLSLIMLNGDNLLLIVGEDYKVYGVGVNRSKTTVVKEKMFQDFRVENNGYLINYLKLLSKNLLKHIDKSVIELGSRGEFSLDEKKIKKLVEYSRKQMISAENLYDIHNKKIIKMFPFVYTEIDKRELKIYLQNSVDNFLSYKNGKWRLKSFHVLKFLILDTFYIDSYIHNLFNNNKENKDITSDMVMNIDMLIRIIKSLLDEGKGGLFLILNRTITKEQRKKIYIDEDSEKTIYEKIILKENKNAQLKDHNFEYLKLISKIDGAVTLDYNFNLLSFGKLIHLDLEGHTSNIQGARTAAALSGSKYGLAIKVSEDGNITIWQNKGKKLEI